MGKRRDRVFRLTSEAATSTRWPSSSARCPSPRPGRSGTGPAGRACSDASRAAVLRRVRSILGLHQAVVDRRSPVQDDRAVGCHEAPANEGRRHRLAAPAPRDTNRGLVGYASTTRSTAPWADRVDIGPLASSTRNAFTQGRVVSLNGPRAPGRSGLTYARRRVVSEKCTCSHGGSVAADRAFGRRSHACPCATAGRMCQYSNSRSSVAADDRDRPPAGTTRAGPRRRASRTPACRSGTRCRCRSGSRCACPSGSSRSAGSPKNPRTGCWRSKRLHRPAVRRCGACAGGGGHHECAELGSGRLRRRQPRSRDVSGRDL